MYHMASWILWDKKGPERLALQVPEPPIAGLAISGISKTVPQLLLLHQTVPEPTLLNPI